MTSKMMTTSMPASTKSQHWFLHCLLVLLFLVLLLPGSVVLDYHLFGNPGLAVVLVIYSAYFLFHKSENVIAAAPMLTQPYSMLLLWTLFVFSYFWSVEPGVSIKLILSMSAFIILAIFISLCNHTEGFAKQLRFALILLLVLAMIYSLAVPSSLFASIGATAFYKQKNTLGMYMGLCILALIYTPGRNRFHIGLALVAMALVFASRSKTSIAVVVACAVLLPLVNRWVSTYRSANQNRRYEPLIYPSVLTGLLALVLCRNQFLDFLWTHLTKSLLTNRGTLWLLVVQHLRGNSLLGIGPGTFWGNETERGSVVSHTYAYMMDPFWIQSLNAADGSYVDLIASIGVLGLALFLYTAVDLYRSLIKNWDHPDSKLIFVLTTFVLLHAIAETTILSSCNVLWLIYLLCYFRASSNARQYRSKIIK